MSVTVVLGLTVDRRLQLLCG